MLNIVGERERPNWDFPAMFGLHNVPSAAHSVACVLYIDRTVQVSRRA